MTFSPNPSPLSQLIRSETVVSGHRNLYCFHYDGCLDVAVKADWDSWTKENTGAAKVLASTGGVPGGFSYGDYLRTGAIAARAPIMDEVRQRVDHRVDHRRGGADRARLAGPGGKRGSGLAGQHYP